MTLRFNGQSPVGAVGAYSAMPGRVVGTVSVLAQQTSMQPLWLSRRNQTAAFGKLASQVDGTTPPVTWLMALQAGRVQSPTNQIVFATSNTLIAGLPGSGSTSISFDVGPSQLELVVSATGSTSITITVTGSAAAVLQAAGTADVTFTVGPATLGAESGVFGNTTITFVASATPKALGNLEGAITPYTELSPQNLAAAVWQALAAEYNDSGTMGNKLNLAASGGVDYDTLAQYVWQYVNRTLTGGSALTLPEFLALKD